VLGCWFVCIFTEKRRDYHVCLLRTEIIVVIFAKLLALFFVIVKSDGYLISV
jgi:hypothetical protein